MNRAERTGAERRSPKANSLSGSEARRDSAAALGNTEADIAHLHALFGKLTERSEPLRFHQAAWGIMLRQAEYGYDAAAVERDLRLLVAYLRTAIRDGKRNDGALKLRNFLAPDQWFADLEEAKAKTKAWARVWTERPASSEPVAGAVPVSTARQRELAAAATEQARLLAEKLRGGA